MKMFSNSQGFKAVAASLLVAQWLRLTSEACSCFYQDYCELTEATNIIVSGTILER